MEEPLTGEELCLVALCSASGVGPVSVNRLLEAAREGGASLREMASLPAETLQGELGLPSGAARGVAGLESPLLAARSLMGKLRRAGGRVVLRGRADYPGSLAENLGARAPAALFVRGDAALLGRPSVAVVGSRRPSGRARSAAGALAEGQAAAGSVIVSGGARGIDTRAHMAALRCGATVVFPPTGALRFHWRRPSAAGRSEDRWCVASAFGLDGEWKTAQALMRNSFIVALSEAVVAFEPRDTGGTWNSSLHALRMGKPLFIATGSAAAAKRRGLRRLVRMGAVALDVSRMPNPGELRRMVKEYSPPPSAEQLPLSQQFREAGGEGQPNL